MSHPPPPPPRCFSPAFLSSCFYWLSFVLWPCTCVCVCALTANAAQNPRVEIINPQTGTFAVCSGERILVHAYNVRISYRLHLERCHFPLTWFYSRALAHCDTNMMGNTPVYPTVTLELCNKTCQQSTSLIFKTKRTEKTFSTALLQLVGVSRCSDTRCKTFSNIWNQVSASLPELCH